MDRNLSPSKTALVLSDSERMKHPAGGKLPVAAQAKARPHGGDPAWTPLTDGGPAALAAAQEHHETRAKPALAAKRLAKGK